MRASQLHYLECTSSEGGVPDPSIDVLAVDGADVMEVSIETRGTASVTRYDKITTPKTGVAPLKWRSCAKQQGAFSSNCFF